MDKQNIALQLINCSACWTYYDMSTFSRFFLPWEVGNCEKRRPSFDIFKSIYSSIIIQHWSFQKTVDEHGSETTRPFRNLGQTDRPANRPTRTNRPDHVKVSLPIIFVSFYHKPLLCGEKVWWWREGSPLFLPTSPSCNLEQQEET